MNTKKLSELRLGRIQARHEKWPPSREDQEILLLVAEVRRCWAALALREEARASCRLDGETQCVEEE